MNMKKIILCSLLITGCSSTTPTVNTKVCDGPDKRTIDKYERHYCKCSNRRDVERALENLSGIYR